MPAILSRYAITRRGAFKLIKKPAIVRRSWEYSSDYLYYVFVVQAAEEEKKRAEQLRMDEARRLERAAALAAANAPKPVPQKVRHP